MSQESSILKIQVFYSAYRARKLRLYFVGEYIKGLILHEYPALLGSGQQILCLVLNPVLSEIVEFSLKFRR